MKKIIISTFAILSLMVVLRPAISLAQNSGGPVGGVNKILLEELDKAGGAEGSGLSAKDPRFIIADIIKTVLSILGIIFLVLMVAAGFMWMTAGGEEKKVEKATGIIKTAVIGLGLVLISYSLTLFVTYWLQVATN